VLEGGSMLVTVADDKPQVVAAGHELRLAQADIFKEEGKPEEGKTEEGKSDETGEPGKTDETGKAGETAAAGGMSTITKVVLGGLAIGGIAALAGGGGGGDDAPASPTGFQ
ncbi:MAG: hypothetical protein MUO88_16685, partial [Desulfobacterales bacterium]|nr:hypothetical protein [Desulfobacterales bacterium]